MGCKLSIYINPLPLSTIAELKARTPYFEIQEKLVAELKARAGTKISVHGFLSPEDFGGDSCDYFDGTHMGRYNGDRLMEYLLARDANDPL